MSGHIANCKQEYIIKRLVAIFREVSEDLASQLKKTTGVKGYAGISGLSFNGTDNGMAENDELFAANGLDAAKQKAIDSMEGQ